MSLKKGDKVIVLVGKDKGKTGSILKVLRAENKVVVEGINIAKVHKKKTSSKAGQIVEIPQAIHCSNVKLNK